MHLTVNDKNDIIIALACRECSASLAKEFMSSDTDITVPERLTKRILRYINRERRKEEYAGFYSFAKRALASILAVCSLSFAFFMSIKAVRQELWNTIVDWYDKYFVISYEVSGEHEAPTTIEEKKEPRLLPYGCEKTILADTTMTYYLQYFLEENEVMLYYQNLINKSHSMIDNENVDIIENISINGNICTYMTFNNDNSKCLEWSDGSYTYTIIWYGFDIEKTALQSIAESVK